MTKIGFTRFQYPKSATDRIGGIIEVGRAFGDRIGSARLSPAAAGRRWYAVKQSSADLAEISLFDEIGIGGITAKQFIEDLRSITAKKIRICINSMGGDVFDGLAIFNAVTSDSRVVEARIDGIAASAASLIAVAAPKTTIAEYAMICIHNAWAVAIGDKNDMADMAEVLAKIDGAMTEVYAKKTGKSRSQIAAAMDAETWYTADEAKADGFVDEVLSGDGAPNNTTTASTKMRARYMRARLPVDERAERMRRRVELAELDLAPPRRS